MPPADAPKVATLTRMAAAGVAVPAWVVLAAPTPPTPQEWRAIAELLATGPVIVRAALFGEDGDTAAAAGLGRSIAGCHDQAAVLAAITEIAAALTAPWLTRYFGGPVTAQVLVQRQIFGPWLAVVADAKHHLRHVEVHRRTDASEDCLALGQTPDYAGPLECWAEGPVAEVSHLCDVVRAAMPTTAHGLDLELVADHDGRVWLVQVRPLTAPLYPGWPAFAAIAQSSLQQQDLSGWWVLDAEHNPAALSPAHAGLIAWLAQVQATSLRVIGGWLYQRGQQRAVTPPLQPAAVLWDLLTDLRDRQIPHARAYLVSVEQTLRTASPQVLADLLEQAFAHLCQILRAHAALPGRPTQVTPTALRLCLRDRAAHLDVLPAAWDLASPSLQELGATPDASTDDPPLATVATDAAALHTLLGEVDDHLFALGLAPLRRIYLQAAQVLAMPPTWPGLAFAPVFLASPDELMAALRGLPPTWAPTWDLNARAELYRQQAALQPPLQLYAGQPVAVGGGAWLRGLGIGAVVEGPLYPYKDLPTLLAEPPPPDAIVAVPTLTAQAAVVLAASHITAVVCASGGAMSHAAIMARELGMSALIGCRGCMQIPVGSHVRLDTQCGRLFVAGASQ